MALRISSGPGVGSKSSDNILYCWACRNRGFPHEAIRLKFVEGRWTKFDYFSPFEPHIHKSRYKKVEAA